MESKEDVKELVLISLPFIIKDDLPELLERFKQIETLNGLIVV
jgi:hypothetical protein